MSHFNITAAAEAVVDAYNSSPPCNDHVLDHRYCMAAALRAVADVTVPEQQTPGTDAKWRAFVRYEERNSLRTKLLAIADELEGAGND